MTTDQPIRVLQKMLRALERLTIEERANLLEGAYELELKVVRKRGKGMENDKPIADYTSFIRDLSALESREKALQELDAAAPSKKALEKIARFLDIPILRQDKAELLREKIVEATTGARIRSSAIRGTN